jgi:hypothetical protein
MAHAGDEIRLPERTADRFAGDAAVELILVIAVRGNPFERQERSQRKKITALALAAAGIPLDLGMEVPRLGILHRLLLQRPVMEDLSKRGREDSVLAEQLRKSHDLGTVLPERLIVIEDADGLGLEARQERRAAGTAEGILHISAIEAH